MRCPHEVLRAGESPILGLVLLSACASVNGEGSFADVQRVTEARIGHAVRWNQGAKADEETAKAVRALLAEPLTAEAAVQIALLESPRLQATFERIGIAQADLVAAGLLENPVFETRVLAVQGQQQPELGFAAALDFLDVVYLPLRVSIAETELARAMAEVTAAVLDLAFEARTAFYAYQAALERRTLVEAITETEEAALDLARRLHAAGNLSDLELLNEEALYQDAQLALLDARARVAESRARVNVLLGGWGARATWTAVPELPHLPDEPVVLDDLEQRDLEKRDLEKRALEQSLELAAARRAIEAAAARLGHARASRFVPELEAGLTVENEEGPWKVGPVVGFPLPLLNWGQTDVARREAEMRVAQRTYVAEAIRVREAARLLKSTLEAARARAVRLREDVLPLRARIVDETRRQYNAMQVSAFELLAARRLEIESLRRYLDARLSYWMARAALDQLNRGRLPPEGARVIDSVSSEAGSRELGAGETGRSEGDHG